MSRIAYEVARRVTYALNRPRLAWLGRAAQDVALRLNGVSINFVRAGEHLNISEHALLARIAARLAGGIVLDVGANVGHYATAVRALAPSARIYAFEPNPGTFAILARETAGRDITAINAALAERAGMATLYAPADGAASDLASLDAKVVQSHGEAVREVPTAVDTVDGFMAREGIERVALLKIDTEGFDLQVLMGAREALAAGRIGIIQFEFIGSNVHRRIFVKDFFELLAGRDMYRLCLNGDLLPLPRYDAKRCEIFSHHILISLPAGERA